MTYEDTLHYLYTSTPVFQHTGAAAYKPGLGTSMALDDFLNNPHKSYKTIHVGGTNGKGSTSHLLAAILQKSGYKVGLYTSPHLVDFRERIRVNGKMISKEYIAGFVEKHRATFEPLKPSFFELTSTMAFDYFRSEKVDFAVVEVGLGGRLDSTNIIIPVLSVITNISKDHTQFLGNTLPEIASEKAGIIKAGIPIVIGEASGAVKDVFTQTTEKNNSPIWFAEDEEPITYPNLSCELTGDVQIKNTKTVLCAVKRLQDAGYAIPSDAVYEGFAKVCEITGLMGRWQCMQEAPLIICDTGHNVGGWEYLSVQLRELRTKYKRLRMIVGMVNDKDINGVLALMPKDAEYYFTQASIARAMPVNEFAALAERHGLKGSTYPTVEKAVKAAIKDSDKEDFLFIGGSSFIVADALPLFGNPINKTI